MTTAQGRRPAGRRPRSLASRAADALVFAPVGALLRAKEEIPGLAEKGRARVASRLVVARMAGEFAVRMGWHEAEGVVSRMRERGHEAFAHTTREATPAAPAPPLSTHRPPSSRREGGTPGAAPVQVVPDVASLAIAGYATLSASQVVHLLPGLDADQRTAIRDYEEATRARRTVLNKIEQLAQSTTDGATESEQTTGTSATSSARTREPSRRGDAGEG